VLGKKQARPLVICRPLGSMVASRPLSRRTLRGLGAKRERYLPRRVRPQFTAQQGL